MAAWIVQLLYTLVCSLRTTEAIWATVTNGPLCYDCTKIPVPRACDYVTQCGAGMKCYTQEVITDSGITVYNAGCMAEIKCNQHRRSLQNDSVVTDGVIAEDKGDLISCNECCDGNYCNNKGCHTATLPIPSSRGPVCFNCHQQGKENTCYSVTVCNKGGACALTSYVTNLGDILFTSGCSSQVPCNPLQGQGHSPSNVQYNSSCSGCCHGDYCNRNCSALSHPVNVQRTTRLPTTTRPTPHDTHPTPKPTQMHVHAPHSLAQRCQQAGYHYDSRLTICLQLFKQQKQTWYGARARCQQDGGDLFVPPTNTNDFAELTSYLDAPFMYWIGATDSAHESWWEWLDGRHIPRDMFQSNEPDGWYMENCGSVISRIENVLFHPTYTMKLADNHCLTLANFICRIV